jgi:hypothetical protein
MLYPTELRARRGDFTKNYPGPFARSASALVCSRRVGRSAGLTNRHRGSRWRVKVAFHERLFRYGEGLRSGGGLGRRTFLVGNVLALLAQLAIDEIHHGERECCRHYQHIAQDVEV